MTTTITPLPRNPIDGSLVLPGYRRDTLHDTDFSSLSAIPGTLTTSGGAISGTSPDAVLRLSTTATAFSTSDVRLPTVDGTAYEWLLFTVDMLIPATGIPQSGAIEFTGTASAGVKWNNSVRVLASQIGGSGGDTDLTVGPYIGNQTGRVTRRVAQLLMFPGRKIAAAMDGYGGVHGAAVFSGYVNSAALTPKITIQAQNAGIKTLDIRRLTLVGGR